MPYALKLGEQGGKALSSLNNSRRVEKQNIAGNYYSNIGNW